MTIDICISGAMYARYESEQAPAIGETVTIFKPERKALKVVSVDHLLSVGYDGSYRLSVVTVDTIEPTPATPERK